MKNNKLPDKNEWEKIVDEAFSSEENHVFSEHYNLHKQKIQRGISMKKNTSQKKKITAAFASVAAAAVLVPTSVFAYNKITASIEKTATYQNTLTIPAADESENEAVQLSDNESGYMTWQLDYVPEGYVFDQSPYDGKFHNFNKGDTFTPMLYRIPKDEEFKLDIGFSADCEEYQTDGKTVMISEFVQNKGRSVFIFFDETRYLLMLSFTGEVSDEEMHKIIDGIKLTETDKKLFSEDMSWFTPQDTSEEDMNYAEYLDSITYAVEPASENIHQIGETAVHENIDPDDIHCPFHVRGYSVTLNSAEFTDSISDILSSGKSFENGFEEYISRYMDENGNIGENIRSWYKRGDGVETLDELIAEEEVPVHILKLNCTFTNDLDCDYEINIFPSYLSFDEDGVPTGFEVSELPQGVEKGKYKGQIPYDSNYYMIDSLGHFQTENFLGFAVDESKKCSKNQILLGAGESTEVEIYMSFTEKRVGNAYVYFENDGSSWTEAIENGMQMFDLCKLVP